MRGTNVFVLALVGGLAACQTDPPAGSQIGAIREPDPAPAPPSDLARIDLERAIEDALALAGIVTTQSAFVGHLSTMERGERNCPQLWTGPLPEDLVDLEIDGEDGGLSWLSDCSTAAGLSYAGFAHWTTALADDEAGGVATRTLVADAEVTDGQDVLWAFRGEAADSFDDAAGLYASSFTGTITGSLAGVGSGLRAQNNTASDDGGFRAAWGPDGSMTFSGSVEAFDGYGPADQRTGDEPELEGITTWRKGAPRFTSVRFDLTFSPDCRDEPIGFLGMRGNEGFWFDVYFLPIYPVDEDTAQSNAFPFEQIDNQTCDGTGTLFSRNVDLAALDEADDNWSRELAPDFDAVRDNLPSPSLESYVFTLRHLPQE